MISAVAWNASGQQIEIEGQTTSEVDDRASSLGAVRLVYLGEVYRKIDGEWVYLGIARPAIGKGDRIPKERP